MSDPITIYALIERVSIEDMTNLEIQQELHASMINLYKSGEWQLIPMLIDQLRGKWQEELDTFYDEVLSFIDKTDPKEWDGIRRTTPTTD
jgi:hypothetical protein